MEAFSTFSPHKNALALVPRDDVPRVGDCRTNIAVLRRSERNPPLIWQRVALRNIQADDVPSHCRHVSIHQGQAGLRVPRDEVPLPRVAAADLVAAVNRSTVSHSHSTGVVRDGHRAARVRADVIPHQDVIPALKENAKAGVPTDDVAFGRRVTPNRVAGRVVDINPLSVGQGGNPIALDAYVVALDNVDSAILDVNTKA